MVIITALTFHKNPLLNFSMEINQNFPYASGHIGKRC